MLAVLGLAGEHQLKNASLSSQLCRAWLQAKGRWSIANGVFIFPYYLLVCDHVIDFCQRSR